MAHELSIREDGSAEFIGRIPAWHALGKNKNGAAITYDEAMDVVGFDVALRPLTTTVPLLDANGDEYDSLEAAVPDQRAVVRIDTRKVLGTVGDRYTVVQNRTAMRVVDVMVQEGLVEIEAAGNLRDGADSWMSISFKGRSFDEMGENGGKPVKFYGLVRTNHVGKAQAQIGLLPLVVVCANTLAMGLGDKRSTVHGIRHTSGANDRIVEAAQTVWGNAVKDADAMTKAFAKMQAQEITERQFEQAVLDVLAELPVLEKDASDRAKARWATVTEKTEQTRMEVKRLWIHGTGVSGGQDAWSAYMAATEALDHYGIGTPNRGAARNEVGTAMLPGGAIESKKQQIVQNLLALCA